MEDFNVKVGFDYADLQKGLEDAADKLGDVNKAAKDFEGSANKAAKTAAQGMSEAELSANKLLGTFKKLVTTLGVGLGVREIINFGKGAIQAAGDYEKLTVTMKTFLKTTDLTNKMLLDLQKFSLKTPLDDATINATAKALLAFNFQGKAVIPTMKILGDVSAGTGKNLRDLAVIYGQVKQAGRLMGQDLTQFTNAGVPLISQLAANLNVSEGAIKKMVSAGNIGFKDVEKAFMSMTSAGGLYFNLMAEQSDTLPGKIERISSKFIELKTRLGEELLPTAKKVLTALADYLDGFDFDNLKEAGRYLGILFTLLKDYGPIVLKTAAAYYVYAKAVKIFNSEVQLSDGSMVRLGSSMGLAAKAGLLLGRALGAIGFAVIIQALSYLIQNYQAIADAITGVTKAQREAINISKEITAQYRSEKKETDALFATAKDSNKTIKQRTEAITELKSLYPTYTSFLDAEKSTLGQIADAQRNVNAALFEGIVAKRQALVQEEAYNKVIDNTLRIKELEGGATVGIREAFRLNIQWGESAVDAYKRQNREILEQGQETIANLQSSANILKANGLLDDPAAKRGGRPSSGTATLRNADSIERAYTASLKKMTLADLNRLTASKSLGEKQINLVVEEINRRKELSGGIDDNNKKDEKRNRLLEEYKRLIESLNNKVSKGQRDAEINNETDPVKRLQIEERFALADLEREKKIALDKFKSEKQKVEITRLFKELELSIIDEYGGKIQEAEGKFSEAELKGRKDKIAKEAQLLQDYYSDRISGLNISNADPSLSLEGRRRNNEAILLEETNQAEAVSEARLKKYGSFSQEYKKAREDFILKNAAYNKLLLDNQKAYLTETDADQLAEIDRQLSYGELSLNARARLEKKKLELLRDSAIAQLKIQLATAAGDTEEVKRLTNLIKDLDAQIAKAGPSFANFADVFASVFGTDPDKTAKTLEAFNVLKDSVANLFNTLSQAEIDSLDAQINKREKYMDTLKSQLEIEAGLKKDGFENDEAGLRKKLAAEEALLKADQFRKLQLQKTQLKQESIIQSAQQAGALATAVANIIKWNTGLGVAGIFTASASIISLFAIWSSYQSRIKSLTSGVEGLEEGGLIGDRLKPGQRGRTDKGGQRGHRIEGTNLKVGAEEFVVRGTSTTANLPFLYELNSGAYDNTDLQALVKSRRRPDRYSVVLEDYQSRRSQHIASRGDSIERTLVAEFKKQNYLIERLDERRPIIYTMPDGTVKEIIFDGDNKEITYRK